MIFCYLGFQGYGNKLKRTIIVLNLEQAGAISDVRA